MSDEQDAEREASPEPQDTQATAKAPGASAVARASVLSRPTDFVQRPGFRNPANAKTKAQKGGKKGGRSR